VHRMRTVCRRPIRLSGPHTHTLLAQASPRVLHPLTVNGQRWGSWSNEWGDDQHLVASKRMASGTYSGGVDPTPTRMCRMQKRGLF
jgi:hypothetical protein